MKKKEIAIWLKGVHKMYIVHHEKPTFIERLVRRNALEKFTALEDINLKIYEGEKVGIIGANGSGKTTLLKIVAGVTIPTRGRVLTKGKVVSLIDLQAGFHPDLSGYENIFLNGLIIGMGDEEVKNKLSKIIKFADIGGFIDAPLYTYSLGMKLRLGFSIAIYSDPDILVLDEGVSAGDREFQKKCNDKLDRLFEQRKTILVVSHWMEFLRKHSHRVIWLDKGKVIEDGGLEIIDRYDGFRTSK